MECVALHGFVVGQYKPFECKISLLGSNLPPGPFKSLKCTVCPYLAEEGHWMKKQYLNIMSFNQLFSIPMSSIPPQTPLDTVHITHFPDTARNHHLPATARHRQICKQYLHSYFITKGKADKVWNTITALVTFVWLSSCVVSHHVGFHLIHCNAGKLTHKYIIYTYILTHIYL